MIDKESSETISHFGLKAPVLSAIVDVFRKNPYVDEVVLYGSRAKGNHKRGSDVDLAVKGERLSLQEINKITLALDNLLLPYTFDLSNYHRIDDPDLIDHIHRVGRTIYKRG